MTTAPVESGRRLGFHVPEPRFSGARTPLPALSVQGSSNGTTNPLGGTLALLFRGSLDLVAEPCRQPNAVGIREKALFWHRAYFRRVTGSGSLLSVFMVAASGGVRQRRDWSTCVSLTRTAAPDTCRVPRSRALSASSAGVPHSSAPTRSASGEGWTNGWTIRDATSSLFVGGRGTMARPQSMGGRKVPTSRATMFLTSCAAQPSLTRTRVRPRVSVTLCAGSSKPAHLRAPPSTDQRKPWRRFGCSGPSDSRWVGDSRDLCPTKPAHSLGLLGFREQ